MWVARYDYDEGICHAEDGGRRPVLTDDVKGIFKSSEAAEHFCREWNEGRMTLFYVYEKGNGRYGVSGQKPGSYADVFASYDRAIHCASVLAFGS